MEVLVGLVDMVFLVLLLYCGGLTGGGGRTGTAFAQPVLIKLNTSHELRLFRGCLGKGKTLGQYNGRFGVVGVGMAGTGLLCVGGPAGRLSKAAVSKSAKLANGSAAELEKGWLIPNCCWGATL